MLKKFFISMFACTLITCISTKVFAENKSEIVISNGYFSFILPNEAKNTYTIEKMDKGIYVCEKLSAKSGEGGFAFGLKIYREPKDYADMEKVKKIGELVDKKGVLYDMVLIRPTEIRYGDGETIEKNYSRLYDLGDTIEIKGINGYKYVKNQGVKGESLYKDILKKYKTALENNWNYSQFKDENLGCIYLTLSKSTKNLLNKIGYTYYDINNDGIDELIIGEISKGESKGIIYDIYTMVDRKPAHVVSCKPKEKYFVCDENFLWNEYPPKRNEKVAGVFILKNNSTEMFPKVMFIYDKKLNKKAPWFVSYGSNGNLDNLDKKTFNERKELFNSFERFEYTPLSQLK